MLKTRVQFPADPPFLCISFLFFLFIDVDNHSRRNFLKRIGTALSGIGALGSAAVPLKSPTSANIVKQLFHPEKMYKVFAWDYDGNPTFKLLSGKYLNMVGTHRIPSGFYVPNDEVEYEMDFLYAPPGTPSESKLKEIISNLSSNDEWDGLKGELEFSDLADPYTRERLTLPELEKINQKRLEHSKQESQKRQKELQSKSSNFRSRFDYAGGSEDDDYSMYKENKNMKNDVKEIITEAVLGFLNESTREEKSKDKKEPDTSFDENVKKKFLKAIQTKDR